MLELIYIVQDYRVASGLTQPNTGARSAIFALEENSHHPIP